MPGPFPGMDPYLENPTHWPGVHVGLIAGLEAALNQVLPPGYAADIGERVYVLQPERDIYPDLAVSIHSSSRGTGGGTAVAAGAAPWVLTVEPVEVREPFVEIRAIADGRQVVTVLELLSPSNKTPGSKGQRLYQQKQKQLLRSQTSLVEVDLLRAGAHTVAAPAPLLARRGSWDYLVILRRADSPRRVEVWPALMRDRLPLVRLPLLEEDPDVEVDLQVVLDRRYDSGAYARKLDYRRPPVPPLSPDHEAWADGLLRERGLR